MSEQALSISEKAELAQYETTIESGLQSFYETGLAILQIRNRRLYRQTHSTLEAYLKDRFGLERSRAYQLLYAAEVCSNLRTSDVQPENEHQLRPLATLPAPAQRKVWAKAVALNSGESPSARQIKELRDELFPELAGRKPGRPVEAESETVSDHDLSPEQWLEEGQRLAREQRLSDFRLGDWFLIGENKFGSADKLIEEVDWKGPAIPTIKRIAAVAKQFPADKRKLDLDFDTFAQAASIGKPELVEQCESEEQIKAAVTQVRKAERVAKVNAGTGQELESDEIQDVLSRFWPRLYHGLVQHIGAQHEARIIAFIKEALHDREFVLRGL